MNRRNFEDRNAEVVEERRPAGQRPSGAARDHEGVARHGLVAVGGVLPGDDAGADRRRDRRQVGPAARSQGERDHRQADPGGHRHEPLPQRPGADQARRDPRVLAPASARAGRRGGRRLGRAASRRWSASPASRPSGCSAAAATSSEAADAPHRSEGPARRGPSAFARRMDRPREPRPCARTEGDRSYERSRRRPRYHGPLAGRLQRGGRTCNIEARAPPRSCRSRRW